MDVAALMRLIPPVNKFNSWTPLTAKPLTLATLASMPKAQQKQAIGERLFPLIQGRHGDLAGKITDKLLEMDNSELLHLLDVKSCLAHFSRTAEPGGLTHLRSYGTQGAGGAGETAWVPNFTAIAFTDAELSVSAPIRTAFTAGNASLWTPTRLFLGWT